MAHNLILSIVCVIGLAGWVLVGFMYKNLICDHQKEINIINEIQQDLEVVRQEVNNLK